MQRAIASILIFAAVARAGAQDTSLVGLWEAKRRYGPDLRGELVVRGEGSTWRATIASRAANVSVMRDSVYVDFPEGGTYVGHFARNRTTIRGNWFQPQMMTTGMRAAMPLILSPCGSGCFSAYVEPLEDAFTFYLRVTPLTAGKLAAFLRNPERNQGRFLGVNNIVRSGDAVVLRNARDSAIASGDTAGGMMRFFLRGATFDFLRVPADSFSWFYPRGRPSAEYSYARPPIRNDGWRVATPEEVGMSREKLTEMVRTLANASQDSTNAYRLHGVLIARHGKLILEEYFLGESADRPHDTRSASKTLVTVVLGAAMQAGMNVSPDTRVYATMGLDTPGLDPLKRAMTLRNLLQMSSGLDCDDSSQEYHPGSESNITDQDTSANWLGMVMGLKMIRTPGAKSVYCSIDPFLAGNVIARATGRSFFDLAWDLVGEPMQMGRYYLMVDPMGRPYMGGGARFLARDFMKMAQLYANGGTWNGRRIVSEAWVRESGPPKTVIEGAGKYGYLWWSTDYTYRGQPVQAHHASGNGGQYSLYLPELDLVVATYGGNYADRGGFVSTRELIPQWILPAIVGK